LNILLIDANKLFLTSYIIFVRFHLPYRHLMLFLISGKTSGIISRLAFLSKTTSYKEP